MGSLVFPITFSFPEDKVLNELTKKTKILSDLIPGKLDTYIYSNEQDYYNEYRQSIFATTTKKGGWDCMRHYEIIANGCIPYFPNIESCPERTMALLPKDLILEGNRLYNSIKHKHIHELNAEESEKCNSLALQFLNFLKAHLTTNKMAYYILEKSNHSGAKRILYLSKDPIPDYLRCVTLHGFKSLFESNCHDVPEIKHIYKYNDLDYSKFYGKGITYTNLLNRSTRNPEFDYTLERDILAKQYDVVIYGSYHRGMPYYDLVRSIYKPNEIILLCGEDEHSCPHQEWTNRGHYVFVREL